MLTLKQIQDNHQEVIERLKIKNFDASDIVDEIVSIDNARRSLQAEVDQMQAEMNNLSRSIGKLIKDGKQSEATKAKEATGGLKEKIKVRADELDQTESRLFSLLVQLPNLPHVSVPTGKTSDDNELVGSGGNMPELSQAIPHWELSKKYNLIDFETGVKLSGSGFPLYRGKGARLQRALISFFLDEATKAGYEEVLPPLLVNEDSAFGTGQLPDKEGQMYHIGLDNLYLIPTAEVPVTNMFRDLILEEQLLPLRNCAYSACFRREAGSYGKDVRGLNRLHQFDKVEIVQISHPDHSYKILDEMVAHVKSLVEKLELPWRVMRLCGGDLGFASSLTYDFEVFSAAQERWLEVSSVSNFETFQSNRLKLRFREEDGKKIKLAHTLNGSALALPRILAALLENNQFEGGIRIPEILVPYCGFDLID